MLALGKGKGSPNTESVEIPLLFFLHFLNLSLLVAAVAIEAIRALRFWRRGTPSSLTGVAVTPRECGKALLLFSLLLSSCHLALDMGTAVDNAHWRGINEALPFWSEITERPQRRGSLGKQHFKAVYELLGLHSSSTCVDLTQTSINRLWDLNYETDHYQVPDWPMGGPHVGQTQTAWQSLWKLNWCCNHYPQEHTFWTWLGCDSLLNKYINIMHRIKTRPKVS